MEDAHLSVVAVGFDLDANAKQQVEGCITIARETFKLDLSRCEGISVAADFRGFSKEFDTGFGVFEKADVSPLAVGFTPEVLRLGNLGCHVIISKGTVDALANANDQLSMTQARYTILHELAHAHEHSERANNFRSDTLALHANADKFGVARRAIWSEYHVCRKVAEADFGMVATLEQSLIQSTEEFGNDCSVARERLKASKDPTRVHADLVSSAFRFCMDAARLAGHLDGLNCEFGPTCAAVIQYLTDEQLMDTYTGLRDELRKLWDTFPNWTDYGALQSIIIVVDEKLKRI